MNRHLQIIFAGIFCLCAAVTLHAQDEGEYDDLLQRIDTVENPVYLPHISLGYGVLTYFGEVRSSGGAGMLGNPAYRVQLTTYIDNAHYITANFFFMGGTLAGEKRSVTDLSQNLNFKTNLYTVGATARYEFGHLLPQDIRFRPYVGLGIEQINFNPKGDLTDGEDNDYYYWDDGSIRSVPQGTTGTALPLRRDYVYETDLRKREADLFGLGDYALRSFAVPVSAGISMKITRNMYVSLGTEYHYTFTDYLDNVAAEGSSVPGNRLKDSYLYTHAALHFDLFSDPAIRTVDLMYAEVDFDPLLFDDEDGDFILDIADRCPGTPYGVVTDTLGCPLDSDNDWVPDYLDKEPDSAPGAWVDDDGVTISEEELLARLARDRATSREDVAAYMELYNNINWNRTRKEIPEKFLSVDTDGDGYISFDELLLVIDAYFDYDVDLSLEELRELNEFFFSQ